MTLGEVLFQRKLLPDSRVSLPECDDVIVRKTIERLQSRLRTFTFIGKTEGELNPPGREFIN